MDRIEVVSFDVEGTLIDSCFSDLIWETDIPRLYAEQHGVSLEDAREHVLGEYRQVGDERPEWYDVGYWFRRLGDTCRVYPEVRGVLERLQSRYVLIVTSNTIKEFLEVQLRELGGFFTRIFSAPSDFGAVKKSAEFYRRICQIMETEPEALAHVGDHLKFDYDAPRELKIHAYYLDRSGKATGDHVVHNIKEFEQKIAMVDVRPRT